MEPTEALTGLMCSLVTAPVSPEGCAEMPPSVCGSDQGLGSSQEPIRKPRAGERCGASPSWCPTPGGEE